MSITRRRCASPNSTGLWRSQRIDSTAQEVRDELAIMVIDVIDQPTLDETRKPVRNVEVLCASPEFLKLLSQVAMFRGMGVGVRKGKKPHQAFFHSEIDASLDLQFREDGIRRVTVVLVGRTSEAFKQSNEFAVQPVDFNNTDVEVARYFSGGATSQNRFVLAKEQSMYHVRSITVTLQSRWLGLEKTVLVWLCRKMNPKNIQLFLAVDVCHCHHELNGSLRLRWIPASNPEPSGSISFTL